jgi:3-hydroxyisobutyrate dehydrogenase-like beta-hydroxyacid dehydrogenase
LVTIGVVAMGEMGSGVARRLTERGARVVTCLDGRSEASAERAREAGAEVLGTADLIREAEIVLSIVPPAAASTTAAGFAGQFEALERRPVYIDCNAIAPQTLETIAKQFAARALPIVDGSIIGIPPRPGYSPKLYLSGDGARAAETLAGLGIDARLVSARLGDASALKMAFGGLTKGFQALGAAMALGAARAGAEAHFLAEVRETLPSLYDWLTKMLPSMYAKAYRWDDEMLEISRFLEPDEGAAEMLAGAAALYRGIAADHRAGPDSEIMRILSAFVAPPE